MKIRRREPPGRSDGDRSRSRRDQGKSPGRRDGPPSQGKRSSTQTDKPAPRSRPKPGGPRGPSSAGSGGTGGRPPRGPRSEARERTSPPAVPVLARTGRELLYGRNAVLEALRGRRSIERLFVAEGAREDERLRGLLALATERGAEIDRIPRLMLDDATRGANHQGIALEAEPYRYAELEELLTAPGTVLVLDHLQDPQNVGTLFRAAEAAGLAGVVIPGGPCGGGDPGGGQRFRWRRGASARCGRAEPGPRAGLPEREWSLGSGSRCRCERREHLRHRDPDARRACGRGRRRWAGNQSAQALRPAARVADAWSGRLAQRRHRRRDRDLRVVAAGNALIPTAVRRALGPVRRERGIWIV